MHKIKSLTQQVYDYIVEEIKLGNLRHDEKINESSLIDTLEISRTPIREALILLASDEILENIPRKGFFVKKISVETIKEAFIVIGHLDSLAAVLATQNLTVDELESMERIVEQANTALDTKDYKTYSYLQEKFHEIYLNACENEILINTINSLLNKYINHTYYSDNKEKLFEILKEVNAQHRNIIIYFKNQDIQNLKASINKHWEITYPDML